MAKVPEFISDLRFCIPKLDLREFPKPQPVSMSTIPIPIIDISR